MSLLSVRDFRLAFDGFDGRAFVLDGIDFTLEPGETLGIVGETGCGKSVLAKSVLRLLPSPPARVLSGSIEFDGKNLLALRESDVARIRGREIAMIFQDPMTFLNPVMSIGRQMCDVIRAQAPDTSERDARSRAAALLQRVRLPEPELLLDRYPHQLSGGMRQRVLIAMALTGPPRLLVADEPTTALDVTIQTQILALLAELVAGLQLSLIMISHDLGVIGATCRRVLVMYAGTIVEDASIADLFARPLHPYTQGLLAAIPNLERPADRLVGIPGSIPDLRHPPSGCRFHDRCPRVSEICRRERPELKPHAGHRIACHHAAAP
jgi:peptide/nickel transport system ATP-binding protein